MLETCTKYVRVTVEKADGTILVDEKPGDEPLFVLRGQDRLAAGVLEEYMQALSEAEVDDAFIDHIQEHVDEMRRWPNKKTPD